MTQLQPEAAKPEVLAGLVERVTYHNSENGFCVLRQFGRPTHDRSQLGLAQWWHIDLSTHLVERFVFLQLGEKICTHAHQHVKPWIGNALCDHLRKPSTLALLGV